MNRNLYNNIFISIVDTNTEKQCGSGYLFSNKYLLTCAHVINMAIGRETSDISHPPKNMSIRFNLPLHKTLRQENFNAYLEKWGPIDEKLFNKNDYAILKLPDCMIIDHDFPPHGVFSDGEKRSICFYGIDGLWVEGDTSWKSNAEELIQIQCDHNKQFTLEHGHSGTPVLDKNTGKIIGVIHSRKKTSIGHMLPVSPILENLPEKAVVYRAEFIEAEAKSFNNDENAFNTSEVDYDDTTNKQAQAIDSLIKIKWDDFRKHLDTEPELLRQSVLFNKAHQYYKTAKENANAGAWSDSIKYYLAAYSIFALMGPEYNFRAARVAGRLSWGFIVEDHFDSAMRYLELSEELDKAEAAGNYFMAIQYSLRKDAQLEQTKKLVGKFIDLCISLELLNVSSIQSGNINKAFVTKLIKEHLQHLNSLYHKRHDTEIEKFSKSDLAKLYVVRAHSTTDRKKARQYLSEAAKHFSENGLSSYALLCELEEEILNYVIADDYKSKIQVIEDAQEVISRIETGIVGQSNLIDGIGAVMDVNVLLLKICERLKQKNHTKDYRDIIKRLNDIAVKYFDSTKTEELVYKLCEKIRKIKETASHNQLDSALIIFYDIYKSIPLLFGDYIAVLQEVLMDKYIKS